MTARDLHALFATAAGRAAPRPDGELLADPDPSAFAELVRRHGPLVWAACHRLVGEADAADAFQAVFLALHRSRRRIRTPAALGGWLHAAAVRVGLAHRRQAGRRRAREAAVARPEAEAPVADAAWGRMLAAVHEEVERLPAGERAAFVLCDLQGVPAGQAAERLGWKPGTLTGRLSQARAKLLARLEARGVTPAAGLVGVGTLAVPAGVAARAVECASPVAVVPAAVQALSREATEMATIKHLTAAVLTAGGLAAGLGGLAVRADPPPPAPASAEVAPPPRSVEPPAPYHPTAVGTRWTHRYPTADIEFVVTAAETKGGETIVSVGRVQKDGKVTLHHKLAVSAGGLAQLGAVAYRGRVDNLQPGVQRVADRVTEVWQDHERPKRLLVATAWPDDTWWIAHERQPATTLRAVGSERVTVPVGTFEAFVVDSEVPRGPGRAGFRHWYVRGLGEVKRVVYRGAGKDDIGIVMTAFARPASP